MRKFLPLALAALLLAVPLVSRSQIDEGPATTPAATQSAEQVGQGSEAAKNADQARAALNSMVQALGGQAWLDMKNSEKDGHFAAFFHGNPDLGTQQFYQFHQWPDHDRIEYTKHRDVVHFFIGKEGWEITYRGKKAIPQKDLDEFLRDRDHSIETAVKVWMKDPKTILIYEGPRMVERHLGIQVSLIAANNDALSIVMDNDTHLPLRSEYQYRDPVYHDLDTETEEYDDYHTVDGFPTAFNMTRIKNGETTQQLYVDHVKYNQDLPANFWDVDAVTRKIKR
ncbi:MAG TPA: hypothetical protein VGR47_16090 [Terracidiphilus sp.]|nr:hypothetical protein [Terracidiphilus sp.]